MMNEAEAILAKLGGNDFKFRHRDKKIPVGHS
jgi:hypothetical protein